LADREPCDAGEKHFEAHDVLVEACECSEGAEMVFVRQAFDDLIEFGLGCFRLPQTSSRIADITFSSANWFWSVM
jgi:hypothetical protein